jgi:hypothetical protein
VVAELPLLRGPGTPAARRAVALVVATAVDLKEQSPNVSRWSAANGLRGGRYVSAAKGRVRLDGVRVVRDAAVSGLLVATDAGAVTGTLRLTGPGVARGQLRVSVSAEGHGRATGRLNGAAVDLSFANGREHS